MRLTGTSPLFGSNLRLENTGQTDDIYFTRVTAQADERDTMTDKTVAKCLAAREKGYCALVEARRQKVPAKEMQIYHDRLTACHDDLAKAQNSAAGR